MGVALLSPAPSAQGRRNSESGLPYRGYYFLLRQVIDSGVNLQQRCVVFQIIMIKLQPERTVTYHICWHVLQFSASRQSSGRFHSHARIEPSDYAVNVVDPSCGHQPIAVDHVIHV